jgi:hypothetical protein
MSKEKISKVLLRVPPLWYNDGVVVTFVTFICTRQEENDITRQYVEWKQETGEK